MKTIWGKLILAAASLALTLAMPFLTSAGRAVAQEDRAPNEMGFNERTPDRNEGPDLIGRLNLTPDQVRQIREIRQQSAGEWQLTRQRMLRAQRALDEAIYADSVAEADIEARARDLAAAQTAIARLRALTELRIRRVLTPEQLTLMRQMRHEAMERNRDQRRQRRQDPSGFNQPRRPNLRRPMGGNPPTGAVPSPQRPPAGGVRRP